MKTTQERILETCDTVVALIGDVEAVDKLFLFVRNRRPLGHAEYYPDGDLVEDVERVFKQLRTRIDHLKKILDDPTLTALECGICLSGNILPVALYGDRVSTFHSAALLYADDVLWLSLTVDEPAGPALGWSLNWERPTEPLSAAEITPFVKHCDVLAAAMKGFDHPSHETLIMNLQMEAAAALSSVLVERPSKDRIRKRRVEALFLIHVDLNISYRALAKKLGVAPTTLMRDEFIRQSMEMAKRVDHGEFLSHAG